MKSKKFELSLSIWEPPKRFRAREILGGPLQRMFQSEIHSSKFILHSMQFREILICEQCSLEFLWSPLSINHHLQVLSDRIEMRITKFPIFTIDKLLPSWPFGRALWHPLPFGQFLGEWLYPDT